MPILACNYFVFCCKINQTFCLSYMYRCKSFYPSLLGSGLDGTEQMDPREVFELWVRDLLPELQVFYSVVLTQHSMFLCALMTYQ